MKLMSEELGESTVITIAHRLNTIIKSDKVLVLENGRKIDFDTPQNLTAKKDGAFAKLLE
jgi:ABC-type multidrug transport system fused ATPase/permease subunit